MNKLLAMLAFVRVAESGSFTSAAAQLGVSVSAVAKAVARLEEDLGAQLLARSTRRLALNDDGRDFYARCQQILNDIEDAEASVKSAGETPKGRLRMALPVLFGRLTFLPRIAEFTARYPDIVLDLSLRRPARRPDRARPRHRRAGGQPERFALHHARAEPRPARDGGVARVPRSATASRRRRPISRATTASSRNFGPAWPFNDNGNRIEVPVRGNLVVTGGDALREAVLLGLGIAQSNWWTVRHDLAVGTLEAGARGIRGRRTADQRRLSADAARAAEAARDDRFPGRDHAPAAGGRARSWTRRRRAAPRRGNHGQHAFLAPGSIERGRTVFSIIRGLTSGAVDNRDAS